MSLETWKKEFLTIADVKDVPKDEESALRRDLKKWEGLRPENLDKHCVTVVGADIYHKNDRMEIDGSTCSLCHHFFKEDDGPNQCITCPLYKVRNQSCDRITEDEYDRGLEPPYQRWELYHNPEPMIELLTKALEEVRASKHIKGEY